MAVQALIDLTYSHTSMVLDARKPAGVLDSLELHVDRNQVHTLAECYHRTSVDRPVFMELSERVSDYSAERIEAAPPRVGIRHLLRVDAEIVLAKPVEGGYIPHDPLVSIKVDDQGNLEPSFPGSNFCVALSKDYPQIVDGFSGTRAVVGESAFDAVVRMWFLYKQINEGRLQV